MKVKHSEFVQFGRYVTSQSVKYLREKIFHQCQSKDGVMQRGVMVAANQMVFIYLDGEFISNVGYFKGKPATRMFRETSPLLSSLFPL